MRPTGVNLTLTNGRCGPALMSASIWRDAGARSGQPPSGTTDDQRYGDAAARSETPASPRRSSGWRCDRAPPARDPPPKTREARARRRTTAPAAEQRPQVGVGESSARPRGKAGHPGRAASRTARSSRRASSSRSLLPRAAPISAFAPSSRRRGSVDVGDRCSSCAAASRASTNSSVAPFERPADAAIRSDAAACASPSA